MISFTKQTILGVNSQKWLTNVCLMPYNTGMTTKMKNEPRPRTIPPAVVQEAEYLSKTTPIPFRDCLEVLMRAHTKIDNSLKTGSEDIEG